MSARWLRGECHTLCKIYGQGQALQVPYPRQDGVSECDVETTFSMIKGEVGDSGARIG